MSQPEHLRLSDSSDGSRRLSQSKQRWLNHAYRDLRQLRDEAKTPEERTRLTNILATLILVDSE